jgi:hypothetical protein
MKVGRCYDCMLRFGSKGLGYHESVTAPTMLTTIAQLNDVYLAGRKLGTRYFDMGFESDNDDARRSHTIINPAKPNYTTIFSWRYIYSSDMIHCTLVN